MENVFLILAVLGGVVACKSIKIIPKEQEWIIKNKKDEYKILKPGIHCVNPFSFKISEKISTREMYIGIPEIEVSSNDGEIVTLQVNMAYQIIDVLKCIVLKDKNHMMKQIADELKTSVEQSVEEIDIAKVVDFEEIIKNKIKEKTESQLLKKGIKINDIEILDLQVSNIKKNEFENKILKEEYKDYLNLKNGNKEKSKNINIEDWCQS